VLGKVITVIRNIDDRRAGVFQMKFH
jgi:hypothetical protein